MNSKSNTKWFDAIYAIAVIAVVLFSISLIGSIFSDVSASASGGSNNNSSQGSTDSTGTNTGTGDNTGSGDNTGTDNDNTGTGSNTGTSGNTNTDGNSGTTSNDGTYTLSLSIIKVSNEPVNDYNVYLNGTKLEDIQLVEGTYYNLIEVEIKENDVLYIEGATLKEGGGSPLFYNKDGKYAGVLRDYEPTMTLSLADYRIYTAGSEKGDYSYGLTIVFSSSSNDTNGGNTDTGSTENSDGSEVEEDNGSTTTPEEPTVNYALSVTVANPSAGSIEAHSTNPTVIAEGETVTLTFDWNNVSEATPSSVTATNCECTSTYTGSNSGTLTITLTNPTGDVEVSVKFEK